MEKKAIYGSMQEVFNSLSRVGIAKDKEGYGYKFRGIDDFYETLSPLLSKNNVILRIDQNDLSTERTLTKNRSGKDVYATQASLKISVEFISSIDGSSITSYCYGASLDNGDKSIAQASSFAFKDLLQKTFCVPFKGDRDPDSNTWNDVKPLASATQLAEIRAFIATAMKDEQDICKAYKIKSLSELEAHKIEPLKKRLLEIINKAEEAKEEAPSVPETIGTKLTNDEKIALKGRYLGKKMPLETILKTFNVKEINKIPYSQLDSLNELIDNYKAPVTKKEEE